MPELCAVGGRTGEGGDPAQDDRVRKPVESLRAQRESSKRGRVSEIGPRDAAAIRTKGRKCSAPPSALSVLFRLIYITIPHRVDTHRKSALHAFRPESPVPVALRRW